VSAANRLRAVRARATSAAGFRAGALAGVAVLTVSYLSVLYRVTDVVGGSGALVATVAATLALALVLGRFVGVRAAVVLTVGLLAGGLAAYLLSIPQSQLQLLSPERLLSDTVALLTGLSVLRLTAADVWALAIAPGPVFLSWYLAIRGRYVGSVLAGGAALWLFVLTGDAAATTTLAGVAGATVAVGFGEFERLGGSTAQVDTLVVVLATMLVVAASVSIVPGGAARPLLPDRGSPTVEASLVEANDAVEILGSIRLSPKVRFTVESDTAHYWSTQAFDRYTGTGWVRTGDGGPYEGQLGGPPGRALSVEQTVTAETRMSVLPAAWKPVAIEGAGEGVRVTPQGNLRPGAPLGDGDAYTVRSRVPQHTPDALRRAGTDYPEGVREAYTQLPDSTPRRVRDRAAEITADAETPYDAAVAIEAYLEAEKRYSLSVERPEGNVADAFLFEMDAGYCTYYATTMVTLLRAQDVPARFVVGYTPGERAGDDGYVVRGLDSHAWVEVYFPEVGWVRFDPTPASPRQSAERARLAEARQSGAEGVDTNGTEPTPTPTPTPDSAGESNATPTNGTLTEGVVASGAEQPTPTGFGQPPGATDAGGSSGGGLPTPSRDQVAFGLVALVGAVAGARRLGATDGPVRLARMWYQGPRGVPRADVERAWRRLEHLLARRYRPRRPGETPRAYMAELQRDGLRGRALDVARAYERAHYGRGVSREEADEAVSAVDALVRESTPLVRRWT